MWISWRIILGAIKLNGRRMEKAAESEFCCATDVADYLAKKGVPFRTAHAITGKIVRWCIEKGTTLQKMSYEDYLAFSPEFGSDIVQTVKGKACAQARTSYGGGAPARVRENIKSIKKRLKQYI